MTTPELVAVIRKNPIIAIGGVLSLALAGAIYYRSGEMGQANADLEEKSAKARQYASNIANAAQLQEQFDALVAANKTIEARLIRGSEIGINQAYFYKLESESGVKFLDLAQSGRGTAAKGNYAPIAFSISLQGEFTQVMAFLRALENGAHYCRVTGGSCSGSRGTQITFMLSVELLGRP